jgi:ABC-2 type transport system permease protein
MGVLPPVFYSINSLPVEYRYLAYALPTTQASILVQHLMGFRTPQEWSIYYALIIQSLYFVAFVGLASKRAVWRER